uniref:HAT C-terminal dimerisation domain-containing protein n=1 Tax=Cajanus cajan TaxID=3821 RepID=A0A151RM96_CAJCA|nr:hypothetical protein KK1_034913 [Cajanus cajan]
MYFHNTYVLLNPMQTFEFVFTLHLMKNILRITHELSQALQRSDQDILKCYEISLVYLLLELALILLMTTASVEKVFSTMNIM